MHDKAEKAEDEGTQVELAIDTPQKAQPAPSASYQSAELLQFSGAATGTAGSVSPAAAQADALAQANREAAPRSTSQPTDGNTLHEVAEEGVGGTGEHLPHFEQIQRAFGAHDISDVTAHIGGQAAHANDALGAEAYATGNDVAFKSAPDLHTTAHEVAHVVQQRAGVDLDEGIGNHGDAYERSADDIADAVVAGHSVESQLDRHPGSGPSQAVQLKKDKESEPIVMDQPSTKAADGSDKEWTAKAGSGTSAPHKAEFEARVASMLSKLNSKDDPKAVADRLWTLANTAIDTTQAATDAEKIPDTPYVKDLSQLRDKDQPDGKAVFDHFKGFESAISGYVSSQFKTASAFAFWSGKPAKDAALNYNKGGVALETSAVGALFNNIQLRGDWTPALWAALSDIYTRSIIADGAKKTIRVFVGADTTLTGRIFDKVEWPAMKAAFNAGQLSAQGYACARPVNADATDLEPKADPSVKTGGLPGTYTSQRMADPLGDREGLKAISTEKDQKRLEAAKAKLAGSSTPSTEAAEETAAAPKDKGPDAKPA